MTGMPRAWAAATSGLLVETAVDYDTSSTKYAVRYWLTDLAADDPTDSLVRTRIFFALARARMAPAIPAQTVFLTEHDEERAQAKREEDFGDPGHANSAYTDEVSTGAWPPAGKQRHGGQTYHKRSPDKARYSAGDEAGQDAG